MVPYRSDLDGDDDRPGAETDTVLQLESTPGFCELYVVGVGGIDVGLVTVEVKCDCFLTRDKKRRRGSHW